MVTAMKQEAGRAEHLDVLIVGAGLSGIGAACHLRSRCPQKSFAILEARETIGGTWDLFRYPGIRSDSDVYTLGYSFEPWVSEQAIADGGSILNYIRETAREHDVEREIRFGHRVLSANWSSLEGRWTVEAASPRGDTARITCGFLLLCTGYYSYPDPYTPRFADQQRYQGTIVHPQNWSDEVEYEDKDVVVIGSGATAITLVPALAERARHVTMVQRSPSYVIPLPATDGLARKLARVLPARAVYALVRLKNILQQLIFFELSRRFPRQIRSLLHRLAAEQLPPEVDPRVHFNPPYNPWDQRLCVAADGDLFAAIRSGRASVRTGEIDRFTERGVALRAGEEIEAELIVTATGLNLVALGGIELSVEGKEVEVPKAMGYKGSMLSNVPNLAMVLGYTNASWTLKCDLTCAYVCRLLNYMDRRGFDRCMPRRDPMMPERPFIDLTSGYVRRAVEKLPRQGTRHPWRLHQNYFRDLLSLRWGRLDDGVMEFASAAVSRGRERAGRASGSSRPVDHDVRLPGRPALNLAERMWRVRRGEQTLAGAEHDGEDH